MLMITNIEIVKWLLVTTKKTNNFLLFFIIFPSLHHDAIDEKGLVTNGLSPKKTQTPKIKHDGTIIT